MQHLITASLPLDLEQYSMVIDVRSPHEFALDHIPGAINMPVLYDDDRKYIGTLYKDSPFEAKKQGAAMIAHNISKHIQEGLVDKDQDFSPLLYCWRGGMRSRSFAFIMRSIGWKPEVVDGGYQAFRRYVIQDLDTICQNIAPNLQVISGLTGVGKTKLLHTAQREGKQVLDLEGLANHKGSLLGEDPAHPQPSQKAFESRVWQTRKKLDPTQPIYVESESNRIGCVHIPPTL